ncbi:class I SAM-dependent methyltransferase [Bacillus sp. FJAT-50079]|uniref:class I SAM-dependent DNA methyltransferase n=1 Tax=Bacillus sp. FJAT-50079 TaxID=2833577 RepID=UPI001BCA0FFD|nr:class I SAM-dependent methyltransferase [Bacillus sp. FJAT-50079]MBS4210784.1 class I SAM-dependent methyltransferase [Bacillus sp. FJAT-50079]
MGTDFNQLFDEWSSTYDETVAGNDPEYNEVFRGYDQILNEVALKAFGNVIEFGVGTGNLTEKLVSYEKNVYGFEPSDGMRKIAKEKLPYVNLEKGDFLQFQPPFQSVDSIVSTYAFHHLTDEEKTIAIKKYNELLADGGKIIFADTVFVDEQAKVAMIQDAKNKGFHRLANDLSTEFYTTIPFFQELFRSLGFTSAFTQMNDFVWLIEATKQ